MRKIRTEEVHKIHGLLTNTNQILFWIDLWYGVSHKRCSHIQLLPDPLYVIIQEWFEIHVLETSSVIGVWRSCRIVWRHIIKQILRWTKRLLLKKLSKRILSVKSFYGYLYKGGDRSAFQMPIETEKREAFSFSFSFFFFLFGCVWPKCSNNLATFGKESQFMWVALICKRQYCGLPTSSTALFMPSYELLQFIMFMALAKTRADSGNLEATID